MQGSQTHPTTGDLVRIRRQRWRVLQVRIDGELALLSLTGASAVNAGSTQSFITPFDTVETDKDDASVHDAPPRRWRRLVRHLIASTAPAGSLRTLARAHVDLLPHQLEPALAIVRGACTRVLLADDVGLGKTIQAGLIAAELRDRAAIARVLILVPAGLREQWQSELRDRFAIDAAIADAGSLAATSAGCATNPWRAFEVAIASLDLVKRPEHLASVLECAWDLLIIDEAHNAAAGTERHAAVDAIARRTPYVVLVTATPHNGDAEAFRSLCRIGAHGEDCAVFRRTRADVRMAGRRRTHLFRIAPTAAERWMHEALAAFTRAVTREHAEQAGDAWLALAVLNKRALSSAHALWRTVTRRIAALESTAGVDHSAPPFEPRLPFDDPDGEIDDADAAPVWTGGAVLADPRHEQRLLEAVARAAAAAARTGESKLRAIVAWLRRVPEPAIVFSEYRDTLQHVADSIARPCLVLHGGLDRMERRAVLRSFPAASPVLLATDAAGEGLNLHERCRIVINLELPWNPVRIEQRIGRVDRIGQARTVHALLLVASRTPEERVLDRLRARIARAREDVTAADPLGVVTEHDIEQLVLRGATEPRTRAPRDDERLSWPALSVAAATEADRTRTVRLVGADARIDAGGLLVGHTSNRCTRARMRGAALVLVEIVVADGCGAVLERCLVPLSIDARRPLDRNAATGLEHALGSMPLVRALASDAVASAQRFTATRAVRTQAISAAALTTVQVAVQPGLFDRRADRAAAIARAAAAAVQESLSRRATIADESARGCEARIGLRLVLRVTR